MTHSYTNPSEKQDLAHLEAGVHEDEELDEHDNCIQLAGLDKHQVERLAKQFNPNNPDEVDIESEYPPL